MTSGEIQTVVDELPVRGVGTGGADLVWKVAVVIAKRQEGPRLPPLPVYRWLRAAVALLAKWRGCDQLPDVRAVAEARSMNLDPAASFRIQSLLSAKDATNGKIAGVLGVGEEVVEAYECLFFRTPHPGAAVSSSNRSKAGSCDQIAFARELVGETQSSPLEHPHTVTVAEVESYLAGDHASTFTAGEAATALQAMALNSALRWISSGESKDKLTPLVKLGLAIAGRTEVEATVRPLVGSGSGKAIREQLYHFATRIRRSFEDEEEPAEPREDVS
jgi:hypothetical protein